MKSIFKYIFFISVILLTVSCKEDNSLPGLWTDSSVIDTFPEDIVNIQGQVSSEIGMSSVTIACDAWNINKVYNLSAEKPKVFNYNYKLVVPENATFDEELHVTVTDKKGNENKKIIVLTYKPDTQSPAVAGGFPSDVNVEYNPSEHQGIFSFDHTVTDDRSLKSVTIDIPSLDISEIIPLSGRSVQLDKTITISELGSYPMTLTIEDNGGNRGVYQSNVIVMLKEEEDGIDDYAQMYVVNDDENEIDYISGYYRYMDRNDAYQYSCTIYAPKDGTHLFFTPTESLTGDKFGTSPYVASKLMNKNGYVVPVVVAKAGYYYVWLDIKNHKYTLTSFEPDTSTYSGDMILTGEGFSFADWSFSPNMENGGTSYRKSIVVSLNSSATAHSYCFTDGSWNKIWRNSEGKWWWLDDQSSGGSICSYSPGSATTVQVVFDTAELWGTMKKIN